MKAQFCMDCKGEIKYLNRISSSIHLYACKKCGRHYEKRVCSVTGRLISMKPMKKRGGSVKRKLLSIETANVLTDPKTNKYQKTKIDGVVENKANPHYVRRNIITKGATLKTELGLVKVTSSPGQDGVINGILLEESEKK